MTNHNRCRGQYECYQPPTRNGGRAESSAAVADFHKVLNSARRKPPLSDGFNFRICLRHGMLWKTKYEPCCAIARAQTGSNMMSEVITTMRNLFDQYSQPENRLSHALAVCLHEDRALLRAFLSWMGVRAPVNAKALVLVEQSLPGDPPESEAEAERRGLPDIVIHDEDCWCVLIESKVQAALTEDQLGRHERTLRRRGFERIHRVALTKSGTRVPKDTLSLTWSGLYEWLGSAGPRCEWSNRLRAYLRAAELRLAQEEYLTEGTLTMFDGFPFSQDNPYTYGEAKRLLKLALTELRNDRSVTDAAEAVQKAGYRTNSSNFRTQVNLALIKGGKFKRVGRGLYTAK